MIWNCWRVPTPPAGHPHIVRRAVAGVHRHRPRIHRHVGWSLVCVAVPGAGIAALLPPIWERIASVGPTAATPLSPDAVNVPEPSSLAVFVVAIGFLWIIRRNI